MNQLSIGVSSAWMQRSDNNFRRIGRCQSERLADTENGRSRSWLWRVPVSPRPGSTFSSTKTGRTARPRLDVGRSAYLRSGANDRETCLSVDLHLAHVGNTVRTRGRGFFLVARTRLSAWKIILAPMVTTDCATRCVRPHSRWYFLPITRAERKPSDE